MEGVERCGHGSMCQAIGAMPSVTVVRTASERVTQLPRIPDQFGCLNLAIGDVHAFEFLLV